MKIKFGVEPSVIAVFVKSTVAPKQIGDGSVIFNVGKAPTSNFVGKLSKHKEVPNIPI